MHISLISVLFSLLIVLLLGFTVVCWIAFTNDNKGKSVYNIKFGAMILFTCYILYIVTSLIKWLLL